MATVKTNHSTAATRTSTRPSLVVGGRVSDATGRVGLQLIVALESVVADDGCAPVSGVCGSSVPTVYDMYCATLQTDVDGRFTDSYDFADDVRAQLKGWVKCTVQLWAQVPGAPVATKVVRWMRPSSGELIAGLSALLADVRCARDCSNKK
jgi:hypothetical protein